MNNRQVLAVSVACGVLAAAVGWLWVASQERALRDLAAPAPALVASRYIASGARVTRGAVEIRQVPKAFLQPGALRTVEEAEGQLALAPIAPGEQLLANKLTKGGVALALAVPPGKRAVALGVDAAAGVAGLLKPGDLVDVMVTVEDGGAPRTFVLMQAAPVLAVGKAFSAQPESAEDTSVLAPQAETVTIAASPFEAEQLAHLELAGRIKLALRSPGDGERIPLPPVAGRQVRAAPGGADDEVHKR